MLLRMLLLLGSLHLAAAVQAADETAPAIKSVGVISAIGDTLTKKKVALMVFGNTEDAESIEDWQLDEFVVAEIGAQLAGRYQMKPVVYSKSDFLAKKDGIFADSDFDGEERIRTVQPGPGGAPDAYIVVTKAFSSDFIARTNQHLFGTGLFQRTGGSPRVQALFVSYEVNVIDGRTLKYMTGRYPRRALDFGVTGDYDRAAMKIVDNRWSDGFVMTAEQRAETRDDVKTMLKGAVARILGDFGFLPKAEE
ncbi:MAG: hypothetical protein ACKVRO_13415 [Micropepsaceae bacterium]